MSERKNVLELRNICKEYPQAVTSIVVLANFSLQLAEGELLAITGASGSGKSTLLHIAGLLDKPTSGEVLIDGSLVNDDERLKDEIRLRKLGFVYQYHHLLKDFTAIENVAMPRLIAGEDYEHALSDAEVLLEKLDLKHRLHNLPGELSGGQQQRVAIARSLINNPKIILADEPTGNLDPASAKNVLDLFINLAKTANVAAIIVTHNPQIAEMVDRVIDIRIN